MNNKKGTKIILEALQERGMSEFEALKLLTVVVEGNDEFSEIPKAVSIPTENGGYPDDWHIVDIRTFKKYLEECENVNIWMLHALYVNIRNNNNSHDSDGYMCVPKKYILQWIGDDCRLGGSGIEGLKPVFYVAYDDVTKVLWVYNLQDAGEVKARIKEMATLSICKK